MWDEPRVMNTAANVLFVLAFLLAVYGAVAVLVKSPVFALRTIQIHGELGHVTRGQIVDALQGRVSGTFFTADVEAIRGMFETIPWVRQARVRRQWPNRLEVSLEEHVPVALWGAPADARLVNTHGEVFPGTAEGDLPVFAGPAGSEKEVVRRYGLFREQLASLGLEPRAVSLSQRQSWQIRLSNGLTMQLGRDSEKESVGDRLARFIAVYSDTVAPLSRRLDYVDLRYPNGFALRVPELLGTDKPPRRKA